MAARPAMVIECTSSRSMRTDKRSDDPERERERDQHGGGEDDGAQIVGPREQLVQHPRAGRDRGGNHHAPRGPLQPRPFLHAGGGSVPGDVPHEADDGVGGHDRDEGRDRDVGAVAHHHDREHRARHVAGEDPEATRAA